MVSSCDEVYFLYREANGFRSDATGKIHKIEPAIMHPLLKGSVHIKRWLPVESDRTVLFPYEKHRGAWRVIPPAKLATEYPFAWKYLLDNRSKLETRESGRMKSRDDWYAYVYPKNLAVMNSPKILVPAIGRAAEYCLDLRGSFTS